MNLPQYGWIQITQSKPWKLILPYKKINKKQQKLSLPLAVGYNNQVHETLVKNRIESNLNDAYPIRIIKKKNYYKVGPLVGILTGDGKRWFKGNRRNFKSLIKMGIKTGILIYVFTPKSLNATSNSVNAYLYLPEKNRWIIRNMPLPDVVYNRIPSRKEENKESVKQTINILKQENIPFFNLQFFNKWELYEWMKESLNFKDILPRTTNLTKENLKNWLKTNSMLYLKPIHGKAGIGFIKIEKKNSAYSLTYQANKITYNFVFNNFAALWQKIKNFINNKEYIIQSGIKLKSFEGNPYDIRVLIQKNGLGIWNVTGMGVRVAGNSSITTHVPRGGYIENIDKVLTYSFGSHRFEVKKIISEMAIKITKHIEKKSGQSLGELSLDLGIDEDNNLWFFEANAKPMEFDEPEIREISLLRLMQYFRYLSGFVPYEVVS